MKDVYGLALGAVILSCVFGCAKLLMFYRAKGMRALATRWGFQYIGPRASRLFSRSLAEISPPLPASFPRASYPTHAIRQVWNVIEGQQSGVSVLIFDSIIGEGKGVYCTFVACQSKQNPFGIAAKPDRLIQSGVWTAVYRVRFVQIPWTIGIQRLDVYLKKLRIGSACEPSC